MSTESPTPPAPGRVRACAGPSPFLLVALFQLATADVACIGQQGVSGVQERLPVHPVLCEVEAEIVCGQFAPGESDSGR